MVTINFKVCYINSVLIYGEIFRNTYYANQYGSSLCFICIKGRYHSFVPNHLYRLTYRQAYKKDGEGRPLNMYGRVTIVFTGTLNWNFYFTTTFTIQSQGSFFEITIIH